MSIPEYIYVNCVCVQVINWCQKSILDYLDLDLTVDCELPDMGSGSSTYLGPLQE